MAPPLLADTGGTFVSAKAAVPPRASPPSNPVIAITRLVLFIRAIVRNSIIGPPGLWHGRVTRRSRPAGIDAYSREKVAASAGRSRWAEAALLRNQAVQFAATGEYAGSLLSVTSRFARSS